MKKIIIPVVVIILSLINICTSINAQAVSVTLRPLYTDISSTTSESAVLMTLSSYSTDDVRYRLFNASNQYNCWNAATNTYISSTSYSSGPQVVGTPSSSATWWILFQRGNNSTTVASYRDRLGPTYGSNFNTVVLPTSTAITSPFNLSGKVVAGGGYDLTVKYVVLGFDDGTSGNLLCATSTELTTGNFILVCNGGTAIKRIEVRTITNTVINSLVNESGWTTNTVVTDIPLPVELISFTSSVNHREATLFWTTGSELNNARFEVERKITENWKTVGTVKGSGTTTQPVNYSFTEPNLNTGSYQYRLKQIDFNGNYEYYPLSQDVVIAKPKTIDLLQNYPNPGNPQTIIPFSLSDLSSVKLIVYDMLGRQVETLIDELLPAGYYEPVFSGTKYASGIYFYALYLPDGTSLVKRMTIVK